MQGITFYLNSTKTVAFFTVLGIPDAIFCLAPVGEVSTRGTQTMKLATRVPLSKALEVARKLGTCHAKTTEHAVRAWVRKIRKAFKKKNQGKQLALAQGGLT